MPEPIAFWKAPEESNFSIGASGELVHSVAPHRSNTQILLPSLWDDVRVEGESWRISGLPEGSVVPPYVPTD